MNFRIVLVIFDHRPRAQAVSASDAAFSAQLSQISHNELAGVATAPGAVAAVPFAGAAAAPNAGPYQAAAPAAGPYQAATGAAPYDAAAPYQAAAPAPQSAADAAFGAQLSRVSQNELAGVATPYAAAAYTPYGAPAAAAATAELAAMPAAADTVIGASDVQGHLGYNRGPRRVYARRS